ncbi:uncharacterized protein (TIRG00374 family) [Weissella uvarum]|uniref:lysylphosphatidylglycerol synthase transmembrane domain-containing protein n=1 Tax=Weissella uvarum TaxID=1479233 RepID=UPI00195F4652|nr:lysylphosphatidylglycerol synthase transmembrane domain-containing protein [Weissella uvarum]MBM7618023.1 uncharacterized protein (TIRG00374 family) [Weissella uvarum]MCM0596242.1 flippase-like domain-containing protein [Weissella uvarum]
MSKKNFAVFVAMLIVGICIFWWSFRDVSWAQFASSIAHAKWGWLIMAVLAMVAYLALEGVVVKIFVDDAHEKISWRDAMRVPLVEQLGNGITPFSAGGQPMQLVALAQSGIDVGRGGSILTMKFIIYQGMIVINFLVALVIGYEYLVDTIHSWTVVLILGFLVHLVVIVVLLMVMYWPKTTDAIVRFVIKLVRPFSEKKANEWQAILEEKISNFHQESEMMRKNLKPVYLAIAVTFVQLLVYYLIPYFILLGLGAQHVNVSLVMALTVLIVMVISLFPIPGGAGGAEVGFSVLFAQFLPTHAQLVIAMILWRLITYYFGMFSGIFAFSIKTTSQRLRDK